MIISRALLLGLIGVVCNTIVAGIRNFARYTVLDEPAEVPQHEYDALHDLYSATNGASWSWGQQAGNPWNFTVYTNPCADQWEGIACATNTSDGHSHIRAISLNDYYLQGYIPESIGNLTFLGNLTLSENYLSAGTLPVSLARLSMLTMLDVHSSLINGQIPNFWDQLAHLKTLDLSYNNLYGTMPQSLCRSPSIQLLNIGGNVIVASIPECIGQLSTLVSLDVSLNSMYGRMPSSIGDLANLLSIDISNNGFTGPIPESFAALSRLGKLSLSLNLLDGTIPSFLGGLSQLCELDLDENKFTGTIPSSLGDLDNILVMYLSDNYLNGTIPSSLTTLANMEVLDVQFNELSGTIPASIGQLSKLLFVSFYSNQLTGTLPIEYCNITLLSGVDIGSNHLSGTIPNLCGDFVYSVFFVASANALTGTIPTSLFQNPNVHYIALSSNYLTGTFPQPPNHAASLLNFISVGINKLTGSLPDKLTYYPQLLYLNFSHNHFTGVIPDSVCDLLNLNYLYLDHNALTGPLPASWRNHTALSYVFFNRNYLTGRIPGTLAALTILQSLNLSSNHLTGPIPANFSQGQYLSVFLLSDNKLSGPIEQAFNPLVQSSLTTLQLSNNQLTGTLPDAIFHLPSLDVFAAVSNCFTGSIPESACLCGTLRTLALDGLQSATSCQNKLFPSSFDGIVSPNLYSISRPITGGIPTCLFGMGNLTTLHLSGNGLSGTLPSAVNSTFSVALQDLSLSHNKLHGKIPAGFLSRNWSNLDLSYNRFTHSLSVDNVASTVSADATLSLEQNRLSGDIPGALLVVQTITVLESNMFACNSQRSNLPHSDPDYDKYQCGSDTLNATIYAWIAVVSVASALAGALWWKRKRLQAEIALVLLWWKIPDELAAFLTHYAQICTAVRRLQIVSAACLLVILAALLPLYAALSAHYGTYTHVYAWTLSAAYLAGTVPFALQFVFLTVLVITAVCALHASAPRGEQQGTKNPSGSSPAGQEYPMTAAPAWSKLIVYGSFVVLSFMVVLGVNIAYVIIVLRNNGDALTVAQISLALFKVAFNGVCSPLLIRWTSHRVLKSSEEASTADLISIQLFVTLVNNIMIPCLVVGIISPSCFYNVFNSPSAVTSTFSYPGKCVAFDPHNRHFVTCSEEETLVALTTYNPPFAYSYQCSSSFITYYAPAYVIMCIIASVVIPVGQVLLQRLHSRATKGTRWFALLDVLLPRILKPMYGVAPLSERSIFTPYFDATQHMITLLTYVGLLLTFGAVFPPLALCFAVTILSIAVFTKLKVGRFVTIANELSVPGYVNIVDQECATLASGFFLSKAMNTIVLFCFLFYTLFLFDTLGDVTGFSAAWWVLLVTPLLAGPVLAVSAFLARHRVQRPPPVLEAAAVTETEMVVVETKSPLAIERVLDP